MNLAVLFFNLQRMQEKPCKLSTMKNPQQDEEILGVNQRNRACGYDTLLNYIPYFFIKLCLHVELLRSSSEEFLPFLINETHEAND